MTEHLTDEAYFEEGLFIGGMRVGDRPDENGARPVLADTSAGPPERGRGGMTPTSTTRHVLPGGDWMLDAPAEAPAVWGGASGTVAWPQGEPLLIVGPEGVGKTTIMQQICLGRIGLRTEPFLSMRVEADPRPVLYVAADRPRQAQRSFARMVSPADREILNERVLVFPGPLPFDVGREPDALLEFVQARGAGTVFLDSLGNVALDLTKDEVGSRINYALQSLAAAGIESCTGHHQRKGQDGKRPKRLEDVYGSRWITAGCGSVFLVWGEPGDLVVEFVHLKQASEEIGPLKLLHDHEHGRTTLVEELDLLALAGRVGEAGLLVADVAGLMFETETPGRNEIEKARRKLDRLAEKGLLTKAGEKPDPARYFTPKRDLSVKPA